jgi:hypothetical protein
LVLIGASAGWMMSPQWLSRFEEVHTWDIDPWAGRLFGHVHGRALRTSRTRWIHHEQDPWLDAEGWRLAGADTLFWFDNVLGQLPLVMLLPQVQARLEQLQTVLKHSHWGSVHDRYSGPIARGIALPKAWSSTAGTDVSDARAQAWLRQWGAHGEWSDHLTAKVFHPATEVLNVAWAFKPDLGHWLEMGWQSPQP